MNSMMIHGVKTVELTGPFRYNEPHLSGEYYRIQIQTDRGEISISLHCEAVPEFLQSGALPWTEKAVA